MIPDDDLILRAFQDALNKYAMLHPTSSPAGTSLPEASPKTPLPQAATSTPHPVQQFGSSQGGVSNTRQHSADPLGLTQRQHEEPAGSDERLATTSAAAAAVAAMSVPVPREAPAQLRASDPKPVTSSVHPWYSAHPGFESSQPVEPRVATSSSSAQKHAQTKASRSETKQEQVSSHLHARWAAEQQQQEQQQQQQQREQQQQQQQARPSTRGYLDPWAGYWPDATASHWGGYQTGAEWSPWGNYPPYPAPSDPWVSCGPGAYGPSVRIDPSQHPGSQRGCHGLHARPAVERQYSPFPAPNRVSNVPTSHPPPPTDPYRWVDAEELVSLPPLIPPQVMRRKKGRLPPPPPPPPPPLPPMLQLPTSPFPMPHGCQLMHCCQCHHSSDGMMWTAQFVPRGACCMYRTDQAANHSARHA